MGIHLRELSESFPLNTNVIGFGLFSKDLHPCVLDESSLSIERIKGVTLVDPSKILALLGNICHSSCYQLW